ncbi:hypothetical protein [Paraburkholderia sp. BR14320]|uniref:hypothetical protein n=1 Tax=unclassified Paraburkholderia TaxID=2615204 RepID=UPI0034CF9962
MAIDLKAGAHGSCTLHTRHEYRGSTSSDVVRTGRQLIASASSWELTRDASQLAPLARFMTKRHVCALKAPQSSLGTPRQRNNSVLLGMDLIKKFNTFHDWYLMGISTDREARHR